MTITGHTASAGTVIGQVRQGLRTRLLTHNGPDLSLRVQEDENATGSFRAKG